MDGCMGEEGVVRRVVGGEMSECSKGELKMMAITRHLEDVQGREEYPIFRLDERNAHTGRSFGESLNGSIKYPIPSEDCT